MKFLLLGATGRTGKHILDLALHRGHVVQALVRKKSKLNISHPSLVLTEGDPLDKASLIYSMKSCEAIVSALNISRVTDWPWSKLRTPKNLLSSVTKNIIELAPQHGISRCVFISAWGVAETRSDIPGWFRWFIDHSNIRYPYLDHERSEELLQQSSLNYTAVRPAGLINSKKEREIIVSLNHAPKPKLIISRRNLARFVLEVLEKDLYLRQMPAVSHS